jgi:ribosomal protein S18 acetylase RimI-like enzyme
MDNNDRKKEIKIFQEYLINSWPAKHYYFINGWILRFTEGVTSRANSVFPIYYTGTQESLDYDIKLVEKAYNAHNLIPIYTIPEYHEPYNLEEELLKRGYSSFDHTSALGIRIEEIQRMNINEEFDYNFTNSRTEEFSKFLAKFSKRNENEQKVIQELNQRIIIPRKCYMITKNKGEIVGTLFAVLIPQGYMYVGDVFIHPDYRRRKIATSMLLKLVDEWALKNGVNAIWLQVEKNNLKALNLYHKFGMKKLYYYFYMKKG